MFTTMAKKPLTPTGANEVLNSLYALPYPALQVEADELGTDFRQWLYKHFDVLPHQQAFIDHELPAPFIDFVQARVPVVMLHHLPISFTVLGKTESDDDDDDGLGKIIEAVDQAAQATHPDLAHVGTSGSFQFIARYYKKQR